MIVNLAVSKQMNMTMFMSIPMHMSVSIGMPASMNAPMAMSMPTPEPMAMSMPTPEPMDMSMPMCITSSWAIDSIRAFIRELVSGHPGTGFLSGNSRICMYPGIRA